MGNPQKYRILTIRFRKSDKRESAILRVLDDLNLDIHKSVNQFVIDAVEYYIAHFDDKELIGPTSDAGKQRYISRVEMNRELQRIENEMKAGKEEIRNQLYEIAMKFAERAFHNEYEAVVAIHTDKAHPHAHVIINSVNMVTGYKFQYRKGDWKRIYQPITNELCEEYGLSIVPTEYSKEPVRLGIWWITG